MRGSTSVEAFSSARVNQCRASLISPTPSQVPYVSYAVDEHLGGEVDLGVLVRPSAREQLAYEDVQGIFRSIGRLTYYPAFAVERGLVKHPTRDYRIGTYLDRSSSTEKTDESRS